MWEALSSWIPVAKGFLAVIGILLSMGISACLFAAIYRWLPDLHIAWKHAWKGAIFTAALFEMGKIGLGIYLGREGASSSYGAAGAAILVLLWIYYTSVIFLTGATFTRACRDHCSP
jgi:membrane protein